MRSGEGGESVLSIRGCWRVLSRMVHVPKVEEATLQTEYTIHISAAHHTTRRDVSRQME